jgi:glycine/D-amino acid oxidase-like deaminating enzyme
MSAFTEAHLKQIIIIAAIALLATAPARSQGLVDPSKVAPEYREAAEKRRAEQIRQRECALKADLEKVLPRDRTDYLNHCLDAVAAKQ